jgi:hypothetical protein
MATNVFLTRDGKLDAASEPAFAALSQRLAAGQSKVLLHLHGGLVKQAAGQATAERLGGPAPNGFGLGPDWEQVYVVWRTGPLETLKTNWPDLFENDRIYNAVLKKLLGFVSSKLGLPDASGRTAFSSLNLTPAEITARLRSRPAGDPFADVDVAIERNTSTGRGPTVVPQSDAALAAEFTLTLQLDPEFNQAVEDVAAAVTLDPVGGRSLAPRGDPIRGREAYERLDAGIRTEVLSGVPTTPGSRASFSLVAIAKFLINHAAAIVIRVIQRFRAKRDHGLYPTVVEELAREMYGDLIGATIWGMMKKDAADNFGPNGFGAKLLSVFSAAPPPIFAVSAHSAGAIWASHLIKAMGALPNPPPVRMSFLAPAVRIDLFAKAIGEGGSAITSFRMFTMKDELERQDAVLGPGTGYIYPNSLLYLVSGLFEEENKEGFPDAPILGMQRFLIGNPAWLKDQDQILAVQDSIQFFTSPNRDVVYSQANGGPGLSSMAKAHGGFDDETVTLASVATFIA